MGSGTASEPKPSDWLTQCNRHRSWDPQRWSPLPHPHHRELSTCSSAQGLRGPPIQAQQQTWTGPFNRCRRVGSKKESLVHSHRDVEYSCGHLDGASSPTHLHPPWNTHNWLLPASPPLEDNSLSSSELCENNNSYQLTVCGTVMYSHIFICSLWQTLAQLLSPLLLLFSR